MKLYQHQKVFKLLEQADIDNVIDEGKIFVAACYGRIEASFSQNEQSLWMAKTEGAKLTAKPPSLKSLLLTDSALELNIKRAHFV